MTSIYRETQVREGRENQSGRFQTGRGGGTSCALRSRSNAPRLRARGRGRRSRCVASTRSTRRFFTKEAFHIGFLKPEKPSDASWSEPPELRQTVDGKGSNGEPPSNFVRCEQI